MCASCLVFLFSAQMWKSWTEGRGRHRGRTTAPAPVGMAGPCGSSPASHSSRPALQLCRLCTCLPQPVSGPVLPQRLLVGAMHERSQMGEGLRASGWVIKWECVPCDLEQQVGHICEPPKWLPWRTDFSTHITYDRKENTQYLTS